jgi:trehalose-6-phosphatase
MKAKIPATESDEAPVDFLMVVGDGRDDEIVFRWANDLGESGSVKNVTTVSLGSRDTQAMNTLTQGVTGKFYFTFYLDSFESFDLYR